MAAVSKDSFSPAGDWTATVEGAARPEAARGRGWLRLYLGLLMLLMIATLALLAWGVMDDTDLRRSVQPVIASTLRLESSNAAITQRQAAIDARLREAETALAVLTLEVQSPQAGRLQAAPAEPARPRRRAGPTPLERKVSALDERVQRVEAAASSAEAHRARIDGRLQRLDDAVGLLGAALGPQSAP